MIKDKVKLTEMSTILCGMWMYDKASNSLNQNIQSMGDIESVIKRSLQQQFYCFSLTCGTLQTQSMFKAGEIWTKLMSVEIGSCWEVCAKEASWSIWWGHLVFRVLGPWQSLCQLVMCQIYPWLSSPALSASVFTQTSALTILPFKSVLHADPHHTILTNWQFWLVIFISWEAGKWMRLWEDGAFHCTIVNVIAWP